MSSRIPEIDYLRCVLILLMVAFHLVYINETYPLAHQWVYTFHMPGFMLISGFLSHPGKDWKKLSRKLLWVFIPYLCMEAGYVVMARLLPIREHLAELTPLMLLDKLLLHPMGPYWYLHTWMLCLLAQHVVCRLPVGLFTKFIVLGLLLGGLDACNLLSFNMAMYFLAGWVVAESGLRFTQLFRPSWVALLPLAALSADIDNLHRGTLGGVCITYFSLCFLLFTCQVCPQSVKRVACFVGRNTLPILLFSPVFTFLSRLYQPWLLFEPTGMLFLVVSVALAVAGSIGMAWLMDRIHVSPWFFGKERAVQ